MVFRKIDPAKDIELPTFIDVVFLLLIFFLVSYSPITPKKGQEELELSLPTAQGAGEVNVNEPLETMLIEIVPLKSEENKEDYEVWVLLPFESYSNSQKGRVTYRDAKTFSMQFQRTADHPQDTRIGWSGGGAGRSRNSKSLPRHQPCQALPHHAFLA